MHISMRYAYLERKKSKSNELPRKIAAAYLTSPVE